MINLETKPHIIHFSTDQVYNNRISTTSEYFGIKNSGGETKQNSYRGVYEESNKIQLPGNEFTPASAMGHGDSKDADQRANSYHMLTNSRNENCQPNNIESGGINGTFKAIMAPIIDILKPNRKENVIGNANEVGNVTAMVPNLPITNPIDRPKTTIKEIITTLKDLKNTKSNTEVTKRANKTNIFNSDLIIVIVYDLI